MNTAPNFYPIFQPTVLRCAICGQPAITAVAHVPVCRDHDAAYQQEAQQYLPEEKRVFFKRLIDAQ